MSKDDLDEVQLALLDARFNRLRWLRPLFVLLVIVPLMWMLKGDHAVWRRWILVLFGGGALLRSIFGMRRPKSCRMHRLSRKPTWVLAPLLSGALFLATGGLDSPLLPMTIMLSFFLGTLAVSRNFRMLTLTFAAIVLVLSFVSWRGLIPDLMPAIFGGGPSLPQPAALLWARTVALLLAIAWAAYVSSSVRDVVRQIVGDAFDARDEVLGNHEAHARELTALSGELAHELKNPLANVKGLAVLVGRDVQGKGVERLEVLQHEVSRMEEILQGFLTFSRPLSPLSQEEVDLKDLCESAVTLHEGMAHAKNAVVEVSVSAPLHIFCDARKVKQILINLIQNALDASPAGASVDVAPQGGPNGSARIEVRDRGPGIPPEVRAHLFEAGSTTKERGTGLGLALARGLARQHGGDLTLEDRAGGGCVAVLTLPVKPNLVAGEAA